MFDLKKVWITTGILALINFMIPFLCLKINGITELILLYIYCAVNFLFTLAVIILSIIIAKKSDINKVVFGIICFISLILSFLTPLALFLPLISYTAFTSEKKASIWKWILGIILVILSIVVLVPFLLATFMMTDSGMPEGLKLILWILFLLLIYNAPILTLYGTILGNKKSPWYYLMLTPVPQFIVGVLLFNIH